MEHGRRAFAVAVQRVHLAEVFLPDQVAIEVEAIQAGASAAR
jgi:hypothetical protein